MNHLHHITVIWSLISTLTTRWESGTPFFWEVMPTVSARDISGLFLSAAFQTRASQDTVTRPPGFNVNISHLNTSSFCLFVLISRSQDKAHGPCGEEMGQVQSNQWCQQRDVKQLHAGADGVTLPPGSVHTHTDMFIFSLYIFYYICYVQFVDSSQGPSHSISANGLPSKFWPKSGFLRQKHERGPQ